MVGSADKAWIVILGALIGVVMLRFAATLFIRLLEKYPLLDHLAYVLIGWVGVKLAMMAAHNFTIAQFGEPKVPEMSQLVFWSVMAVLVVGGTFLAVSKAKQEEAETEDPAAVESAVEEPKDGEEA
jgi:predicted tellurium resistance membrane protein TerC